MWGVEWGVGVAGCVWVCVCGGDVEAVRESLFFSSPKVTMVVSRILTALPGSSVYIYI